ncbi:MAG: guanylate kinase [Bdellovibrionota bacterium]|nr:guanylate kinase [Bdellovibrionota bacterium]
MKAKLLIIAAPSGAGKNTFINRLIQERPDHFVHSISYTTRNVRDGEVDGNPYYFLTEEDFRSKMADNFFAEWAEVHGNLYGTGRAQLEKHWAVNRWVVMDVDVKGAENLKKEYPEAVSVFILPPSIETLRHRLSSRKGKTDDLELRLANAVDEMLRAPDFDHQITNDNFDQAYAEFDKIIDNLLK